MAVINVRNLSDEAHRALRVRAAQHGRSMEAEVRTIIEAAVLPPERMRMGTALVELFRPVGGIDLDIDRDRTPAEPIRFDE